MMFAIYIALVLESPPSGPTWGPHVPFEHPCLQYPEWLFQQRLVKTDNAFSRRWWNSNVLTPPPPPPPPVNPLRTQWDHPRNCQHFSSPNRVSTQNTNWMHVLLLDLERQIFKIHKVLAFWGPLPRPPWGPHIPFEKLLISYP